ncbi:maltokinase N-terminal cap-like domain-containing protein [Marinitenerispora sediminis]|uniref:Maltokinase n=1 Tax=Marinitenerispora sediminis TaxID=1931232 RepID=A0A368T4B3_9ACTN|nr:phosphotransferase [Marinitenerispora sediminis]RCV49772.1 aminoglycoside phosphotransferase [Marinitenerispora sediminis]RCV57151.1 aminoglycoside phosphotransferase [Marinitenerispora sediminis]RCV57882.1 aminoglycoside phosphotransferase [Marinitenerispora sediminis]
MTQLEELLATWIPQQRWFAGKGLPVDTVTVEEQHVIIPGVPGLRALVVAVGQGGVADRYQVLLGLRRAGTLGSDLRHASIGSCELALEGSGGTVVRDVYDGAHDPELTGLLLQRLAEDGSGRAVRFRRLPGVAIRRGLRSLVLTGEQSNTSLVFDEEYILKLFRRLWPGHNPDLEVTAALAGSPFVARPYGWIEADLADPHTGDQVPTTLAMLQEYLRSATDGWVLAATSVRDLYGSPEIAPADAGGDFAGEAERLGSATAAVHRDLARALPTDVLSPAALAAMAGAMAGRLHRAVREVDALAPYASALRAAFDAFARLDAPLPVQRVHGDYHLGQVVRTDGGWVLLDFEGEPAVPVAERQRLSSPLRDVAGMLRSFDYAARHQLIGHPRAPELAGTARAWAQRNREAFSVGYAYGGGIDPEKHQTVLRAFEYDKAVYEVLYEARHRPSWLRIPLDSIAALAG